MLAARWTPLDLDFTFEAITSRERMWHKRTYLVQVYDSAEPDIYGVGECALFRGLSADDVPDYEDRLSTVCAAPQLWRDCTMPSVRFGFETAFADLQHCGKRLWISNGWTRGEHGIAINGLIWMGDKKTMAARVAEKLDQGFKVLKLKIGGINFEQECDLLESIRRHFGPSDLEIRLDANGSFTTDDADEKLCRLAGFHIHSIEQPIAAGQWEQMSGLCRRSPIPIALDEELIGYRTRSEIVMLLEAIGPQYIILKPTLIGGTEAADAYVSEAEKLGIGWWATSALESNVGLNAIAQWISGKDNVLPQGLGTGRLYNNNIASPLEVEQDKLYMRPWRIWADFDNMPWRI